MDTERPRWQGTVERGDGRAASSVQMLSPLGARGSPPSGQSWRDPTGWQPWSILHALSLPGATQTCPRSGAWSKASPSGLWPRGSLIEALAFLGSTGSGDSACTPSPLPSTLLGVRSSSLGRNPLGAQECMGVLGGVWCVALSGPHATPAQARQFPGSRAWKAWVGSEGRGVAVGLAAVGQAVGMGEASSRAPERHPGGCSGLQSAESEGGRVLESPGAALWRPQQNLHKEGGPCAHLWGQKRRWSLKRVVVSLRNPPESLGRRGDPPPPPAPGTVLQQL